MSFIIFVMVTINIFTIIKILYLELEAIKLKEEIWIYKTALKIEQGINNKLNN